MSDAFILQQYQRETGPSHGLSIRFSSKDSKKRYWNEKFLRVVQYCADLWRITTTPFYNGCVLKPSLVMENSYSKDREITGETRRRGSQYFRRYFFPHILSNFCWELSRRVDPQFAPLWRVLCCFELKLVESLRIFDEALENRTFWLPISKTHNSFVVIKWIKVFRQLHVKIEQSHQN